jgi:hypothetical protein
MADDSIEAKALALVNEVEREEGEKKLTRRIMRGLIMDQALCRAIEQHEAFKQEVSDVVEAYLKWSDECLLARWDGFDRFVIPKPDPLVDVAKMMGYFNTTAKHWAGDVRAALEARGLEIREKNDEG